MDRRGAFLGPLLITVGVLLLLSQAGIPAWSFLWPLFMILPGAAMLLRWFTARGDSGLVFSGTLLVLIGGFFQIEQWVWIDYGDHWPFFPLAVGLAMIARGLADSESRDSLIPGGILLAVGIVFYFFSSGAFSWLIELFVDIIVVVARVVVPLGLIAWGGWLLFGKKSGLGGNDEFPEKIEPHPDPAPAAASPGSGSVVVPPAPAADPVDAEFEEAPDDDPRPGTS